MLGRILDCLCHPKYIGMYYKDRLSKVIGVAVIVFMLFVVVCGIYTFNKVGFDYQVSKGITNSIQLVETKEINYDSESDTLSGEEAYYNYSYIGVQFLGSKLPVAFTEEAIVLDFKETYVGVYVSGYEVKQINYSETSGESFSLKAVGKGDITNIVVFQDFIHSILEEVNVLYQGLILGAMISQVFTYYIGTLILVFFVSIMHNPGIDKKTRFKLCIYSTLIYLFAEIFVLLCGAQWISYVGIILAVVYPKITFSHIRRK